MPFCIAKYHLKKVIITILVTIFRIALQRKSKAQNMCMYAKNKTKFFNVNPLLPSVTNWSCLAKNSILKSEGIMEKISYARHVYESVDDRCLS